jgi:hypothetical protein
MSQAITVNGTTLGVNDPDSLTSLLYGSLPASFARGSGLATICRGN